MGWLTNRLPTACGLALERGASPSGLAVVWLERGASAIVLKSDMPAAVTSPTDGGFSWQ